MLAASRFHPCVGCRWPARIRDCETRRSRPPSPSALPCRPQLADGAMVWCWGKQSWMEGWSPDRQGRLCPTPSTRSSSRLKPRLCARAPAGDGAPTRSTSSPGRSCGSHRRQHGEQCSREPPLVCIEQGAPSSDVEGQGAEVDARRALPHSSWRTTVQPAAVKTRC